MTRADDEALQELIGPKTLRTLNAVSGVPLSLKAQRDILFQQRSPTDLLKAKKTRTTILDMLSESEATLLLNIFGRTTEDPHAGLRDITYTGERFNTLLEFFELPKAPSELVIEQPASVNICPQYALFEHQRHAAEQCIAFLGNDPHRAILHMPTGSGKTRTAMHLVCEFLRNQPDKSVAWLAHSEELCEQAAAEFEIAWGFLGNRSCKVHRFWGSRELDVENLTGDFVVSGLSKIFSSVKADLSLILKLGKNASLVIMDEAHQAIAPSYQTVLQALVEPYPQNALLGLTATPGRTWNDTAEDEKLANFFAHKKVLLTIDGFDNPVDYLIEHQYLAKAEFHPVHYLNSSQFSEADISQIENAFDIPAGALERLAEDEKRNLLVLDKVKTCIKSHQRVMVFAATVEHSDALAYVLRTQGIWAKSVTGKSSQNDRVEAIKQYKQQSDEPRVLCNFGVLTTGFDAPATSCAIIARPTKSLVLYSQMVGRATRGRKAGGSATAEIYTVVDSSLPGFGDLSVAFVNWEDVWRTK